MEPQAKPDRAAVEALLTVDGERLTWYQISKGTGLHVSSICKVFNGTRRPSLNTASRISVYLGCTVEQLKLALRV